MIYIAMKAVGGGMGVRTSSGGVAVCAAVRLLLYKRCSGTFRLSRVVSR